MFLINILTTANNVKSKALSCGGHPPRFQTQKRRREGAEGGGGGHIHQSRFLVDVEKLLRARMSPPQECAQSRSVDDRLTVQQLMRLTRASDDNYEQNGDR